MALLFRRLVVAVELPFPEHLKLLAHGREAGGRDVEEIVLLGGDRALQRIDVLGLSLAQAVVQVSELVESSGPRTRAGSMGLRSHIDSSPSDGWCGQDREGLQPLSVRLIT